MNPDIINDKKLNSIVTKLFTRGRNLNISIVFVTQSYFKVSKKMLGEILHIFLFRNSE